MAPLLSPIRVSLRLKAKRFGPYGFLLLFALTAALWLKTEPLIQPTHAQSINLYSNQAGDDLRKTFTNAILKAQKSIVCIIYSLTDDEIVAALNYAAGRNVQITVVCDAVATQHIAHKLAPSITLVPVRRKGLMHNKLLAIDNQISWLGSCNFTRDSLLCHANLVTGIWSETIASAIQKKAEDLQRPRSANKQAIPSATVSCNESHFELLFLPDEKRALDKVVSLLQTAEKSVKVAMFTFTHPRLIQTLIDLHRKGITVEVVLDSDSSRKTSRIALERLKREKVHVLTSRREGLLHEKVAIIDDAILIGGSANWTKAAFSANDEHIFVLHNIPQELKKKLTLFWNTTIREAVAQAV